MHIKRICFYLVISLTISSSVSSAEIKNYRSSWLDLNYAACEGLGVNGSGKVSVSASYQDEINTIKVNRFTVLGSYAAKPMVTANLFYTDSQNSIRRITLSNPWYDIVHEPGTLLVLPQVATSAVRPGYNDSLYFNFNKGSSLELKVKTMFTVPGGSCVSSFSQEFKIP